MRLLARLGLVFLRVFFFIFNLALLLVHVSVMSVVAVFDVTANAVGDAQDTLRITYEKRVLRPVRLKLTELDSRFS